MNLEHVFAWIDTFAQKVHANKAYLNDLDTPIGDGDHGSNMSKGLEAVQVLMKEKTFATSSDFLKATGMALISKVGGASGPLYGSAFLDMAKSSAETDDPAKWFKAGLDAIQKRGKAVPGEKTMVDVWDEVVKDSAEGKLSSQTMADVLKRTTQIKATKGRASYLGDRAIGHTDPGSMSSTYLFEAFLEVNHG